MVLFLVSCTAPSGREYHDGPVVERAPVFVTPGHTPAGAGLPEYMPVYETPTIERGRDRRVLPPTREPGIWASDEPRAGDTEPVPADPILFGVRLPFAPEAQTDLGRLPTRLCAFNMGRALSASSDFAQARRLNDFEKACLAAKLYAFCAATNLSDYKGHVKETGKMDEVVLNRLRNVDRIAKQFETTKCEKLPALRNPYNSIDRLATEVAELWRASR